MKKNILRVTILITAFFILSVILYGLCYLAKEYSTPRVYEEQVIRYSFAYEVDANLVYAVIKAESGFDRRAVSKKGAEGLMQLTRTTSIYVAEKLGENPEGIDLFDADTNLKYGTWYLSYLIIKIQERGPCHSRIQRWGGQRAEVAGGRAVRRGLVGRALSRDESIPAVNARTGWRGRAACKELVCRQGQGRGKEA